MTKKIGVFHNFIVEKIKERNDKGSNIIKRAKVKEILYLYHVPIRLHNLFLKEMEASGLIKIKDKQNIKILR